MQYTLTYLGNIFLHLFPQAKETKAKTNKWDLKAFAQRRKL